MRMDDVRVKLSTPFSPHAASHCNWQRGLPARGAFSPRASPPQSRSTSETPLQETPRSRLVVENALSTVALASSPPPAAGAESSKASALRHVYGAELRELFARYATGSQLSLSVASFHSFAREYNLVPSLLPLPAATSLFKSLAPPRAPPGSVRTQPKLDFSAFSLLLVHLACKLFGSEGSEVIAGVAREVRLLLFWIDQGSKLFRGNGPALLQASESTGLSSNRRDLRDAWHDLESLPFSNLESVEDRDIPRVREVEEVLAAIYECAMGSPTIDPNGRSPAARAGTRAVSATVRTAGSARSFPSRSSSSFSACPGSSALRR